MDIQALIAKIFEIIVELVKKVFKMETGFDPDAPVEEKIDE